MAEKERYPSDVSDEEWAFVAPYLTLMTEDAPQRVYPMREVFNGLRYISRSGAPWRMMPRDLPPWHVVYQQTQRWLSAGVFQAMVDDLRAILRMAQGRNAQGRNAEPTAVILDSRTLQSSPESGARAGYDGAKRKKGSKVHVAVDTLGHLLAVRVTPANEGDRAQVEQLAQAVQDATGHNVQVAYVAQVAYVDAGYTGEQASEAAGQEGIRLEVVKLADAKRGFILLPRRWVVERSFAWATRFRRLARDYERLPETLAGLHFVAFAILMAARFVQLAHFLNPPGCGCS
jgi:transposase